MDMDTSLRNTVGAAYFSQNAYAYENVFIIHIKNATHRHTKNTLCILFCFLISCSLNNYFRMLINRDTDSLKYI